MANEVSAPENMRWEPKDLQNAIVRVCGDSPDFDPIRLIRTEAELDTYVSDAVGNNIFFPSVGEDGKQIILDGLHVNLSIFDEYAILVAYRLEGSGSIGQKLLGVQCDGENLTMFTQRYEPEVGTCDMAGWLYLVAIPKSCLTVNTTPNLVTETTRERGDHWMLCGENGLYFFLTGEEGDALQDLLEGLSFADETCDCLPELTVYPASQTQTYGISLSDKYVRFEGKQCKLTEEQFAALQGLLEKYLPADRG